MSMTDRAGQRISRIGARGTGQFQQPLHHLLHLFLVGMAISDHGLFHLQGGVFGHRQVGKYCRANRRAACLAEQQRGLRVDVGAGAW